MKVASTRAPEDGADERRNVSEYRLNSVTWRMRIGALNSGLMKTDNVNTTQGFYNIKMDHCRVPILNRINGSTPKHLTSLHPL
jgi:hypothetical protein